MKNWYFDFSKVPHKQKLAESNITQSESTITDSEVKRNRTKKIEVEVEKIKINKNKSEHSFLNSKRKQITNIKASTTIKQANDINSLTFILINNSTLNESWNNIKLVSFYTLFN